MTSVLVCQIAKALIKKLNNISYMIKTGTDCLALGSRRSKVAPEMETIPVESFIAMEVDCKLKPELKKLRKTW